MSAIVAIVGRSKTGKTSLIEKLIPELNNRGYRVATIKNTFHKIELDVPGTDTWRHIKAGSEATILNAPNAILVIKQNKNRLENLVGIFGTQFDIVVAEGFKESTVPKIEVHRREKGPPLEGLHNLLAIATDEKLDSNVIQLSLNDIGKIADLIENEIKKPTFK